MIEMGARPYNPTLGRFVRADPIDGGNSNAYVYVDDPINQYDLDGQWCRPKKLCRKAKQAVKSVVSVAKTGYDRTIGNPNSRTNAFLCLLGAARARTSGFSKCRIFVPDPYGPQPMYES